MYKFTAETREHWVHKIKPESWLRKKHNLRANVGGPKFCLSNSNSYQSIFKIIGNIFHSNIRKIFFKLSL